jgi:monoamine oxidase
VLDVAIIGAGAAGLGAAKTALSKNLSFKVLEAASFVGGRARTDTKSLGVPYDLGCRSLYGGSENPFLAFAHETGARLGPATERNLFHDGARFLDDKETAAANANLEQFESDLASAHQKASGTTSLPDRSQADLVDPSHPLARYLVHSDHPSLAPAAEVSLADPGCIVLPTIGEEVLDGYGALILNAAADVPVTVNCPVSAIDLSGKNVALETPMGRIDARTVVVTVSTAVLAAERIALLPGGWPNSKMAAIEAVPMISSAKIGFRLKPGALPSEFTQLHARTVVGSFIYCAMDAPENIGWLLGVGEGDRMTAYVAGAFSRELALKGEEAQINWATEHLRKLLGSSIQQSILGTCATPFDREPWIDGGNSCCRAGTGNRRPALAEPIEDRVFFAGEACSPDYPGTAHGAWLSGGTAIEAITSAIAGGPS